MYKTDLVRKKGTWEEEDSIEIVEEKWDGHKDHSLWKDVYKKQDS